MNPLTRVITIGVVVALAMPTVGFVATDAPAGIAFAANHDSDELIEIEVDGDVSAGENVTITATHAGTPVDNASVKINGDHVGKTGPDGTIEVTVPDSDEFEIEIEKEDLEGERTFSLEEDEEELEGTINVSVDGNVSVGENVTITATYNGSPVANASVKVNGDIVGVTDSNGMIEVTVPDDDEFEIEVKKEELEGEWERSIEDEEEEETEDEEDEGGENAEDEQESDEDESGPASTNFPESLASFSDTKPIKNTTPKNLGGKLRVERTYAQSAEAALVEDSAGNYTFDLTVSDENATNVTFYVQKHAFMSSQGIENFQMLIDGEEQPFYEAGPGNSPWVAFQVDHFSTRTVTFRTASAEDDEAAEERSEKPTEGGNDGTAEEWDADDNGSINTGEVLTAVEAWANGNVPTSEVLDVIDSWVKA